MTNEKHSGLATMLGAVAVVLWGTTIPVSGHVSEALGSFTTAALVYTVAGVVGLGLLAARGQIGALVHLPRKYLLGCGGLVVGYTVLLYWAIGTAAQADHHTTTKEHQGVVIIGNYLWPGFTLLFSLPILGRRARLAPLMLGLLAYVVGLGLVVANGKGLTSEMLTGKPMLLGSVAAVAAVMWGLYSNLAERWGKGARVSGMPLFLLLAGLASWGLAAGAGERQAWTGRVGGELAFVVLFPTLLAYVAWDAGMRKGNSVLLGMLSYFIPTLSLVVAWLYGSGVTAVQWGACGMIIVGAFLCRLGMKANARESRMSTDKHG